MSDKQENLAPNLWDVQLQIKQIQSKLPKREELYDITLVTPMYGGGSKAREINEKHPIREASIRGHLRFWWRATRGAECKNVLELRKWEAAIFGDTTTPSRVKIWTETVGAPPVIKKTRLDEVPPPSYVLFSVRKNPTDYLENYSFRLHIRYDEADLEPEEIKALRQELHAALWAWINFGGLGSRTRRGAGSLYCPKFSPPRGQDLQQWYDEKIGKYELDLLPVGEYRDWPTLSTTIHFNQIKNDNTKGHVNNKPNIMYHWKDVINTYHCFRQRRNEDEDGNKKRSLWPEPDSIRRIMGRFQPGHERLFTLDQERLMYAFPRSQLGMPIITTFHPKDHDEPYKTELLPVGKDRLASPLILKAIAVDKNRGIGAIIVLNHKPITGLKLRRMAERRMDNNLKKATNSKKLIWEHIQKETVEFVEIDEKINNLTITPEHIYSSLKYGKSPMKIEGIPTTSAIEAFLNSEEVRRWNQGKSNTPPRIYRPKQNQ
ncbi:type III-B CRISPR module RAMP protein Cmr1 [Paenibacillus sp. NPDC057934]|uniref:type III-B CRISPR module RAMP protein Cmr1 n=1 Tax=Paenibacillus sp. NPDC057934 TaxID=3346282 RepID=UPI0036D91FDF